MVRSLLRCRTLIHEGPGLWAFHVASFEGVDAEASSPDQVVHLAIEVTTPTDPLPIRRQTMLPASNPNFRRQTVLDEKQSLARLENPPHLVQVITTASLCSIPNPIAALIPGAD